MVACHTCSVVVGASAAMGFSGAAMVGNSATVCTSWGGEAGAITTGAVTEAKGDIEIDSQGSIDGGTILYPIADDVTNAASGSTMDDTWEYTILAIFP